MVLTWSRGSDGAHRFSCDRKLLASSDTTSDIFRRFLSFRVFDSSFTSLLFSKQCQAAVARFFGCGSCRRSKGIGIFKLPIASDESNCKWREAWLSEITKTRMMDQDFRNQITNDRVYTCEKHFNPEDIEICK